VASQIGNDGFLDPSDYNHPSYNCIATVWLSSAVVSVDCMFAVDVEGIPPKGCLVILVWPVRSWGVVPRRLADGNPV